MTEGAGRPEHLDPERTQDPDLLPDKTRHDSGTGIARVKGHSQAAGSPSVRIIQHATPSQYVIIWLVGVLLASLIPLLFLYFHGLDKNKPPSVFDLLGDGNLLLISLVVTIAGIAELAITINNIGHAQLMQVALILLGAVLAVAAEALWYADVSAQLLNGQKITSTHVVTYGSLLLFILSAFCSSMCVKLAAGTR